MKVAINALTMAKFYLMNLAPKSWLLDQKWLSLYVMHHHEFPTGIHYNEDYLLLGIIRL